MHVIGSGSEWRQVFAVPVLFLGKNQDLYTVKVMHICRLHLRVAQVKSSGGWIIVWLLSACLERCSRNKGKNERNELRKNT